MENQEELKLTVDSSWEEAYGVFQERCCQKEVIIKLLEAQKSKIKYSQMAGFLDSQLVKNRFKEGWKRECDKNKQANRSLEKAFLETIDQTFGNLIFDANFHLGGIQRSPDLESFTEEELKQIGEEALFARQLKDLYLHVTR